MHLQLTNENILKLWKRIPKNIVVAFISALLIGLITHMFMFTNTLPTHDEVKVMTGYLEWATAINGRWLTDVAVMITSTFSMPWVNGFLSIVFLSISSCLIVSATKVKGYLYCILISGVIVTMPAVAGIFSFMQMSAPYFLSLMLACSAAFFAQRYKFGFIFATIPIVLSMAIYQAFFSVTAAILIIVLILDCLNNQIAWKKALLKGIKFIGTLGVGMILYLLSIRVFYPDGLQTDYQGLDRMGQMPPLYDLENRLFMAYREIVRFFMEDGRNFHYSFMNIVFILAFAACGLLLVLWCIKKKLYKEPVRLLLLGASLILLPLGSNLIYIMGAEWIHDLMVYASVFILVFVLIIADLYFSDGLTGIDWANTKLKKALFVKIASVSVWFITLAMSLTIYNYWIVSNQVYFKLNIGYQTTFAQSVLLVSRIQSIEGYTYDKDIVIVGSPHVPQGIPELRQITVHGALGPELFGHHTYSLFLRHFLNFTQNVQHLRYTDIRYGGYEFPNIVRDMPIYPDEGSIAIIDGVIYVRFAHID